MKRKPALPIIECKTHYVDNQGLCHYCGLLMEPDWYEHYLHGTPTEKPDTKKPRARKKSA